MNLAVKPILFMTSGVVNGICFCAVVLLLATNALSCTADRRTDSSSTDLGTIEGVDSVRIQLGKKIVSNICVSCHLSRRGDLRGKVLMNHPEWGLISTGNLTSHASSPLADYNHETLARFLRTGIKVDGEMALPMMPKFSLMSDEDMDAVIAFLYSEDDWRRPVQDRLPESEPSPFLQNLMGNAIKPVPYDGKPIEHPQVQADSTYGAYLVNGRYSCFECHSRSTARINYLQPELSEGYLGGGSKLLVYGAQPGSDLRILLPIRMQASVPGHMMISEKQYYKG